MTDKKIQNLTQKLDGNIPVKIAIFGLGSVGNYLLNYLLNINYCIELHIVGRSKEKMQCDINIAMVAADIRRIKHINYFIHEADFSNISQLSDIIGKVSPDFIINSSRAYSHLKYGSISWNTVRAYGIWSPLSVKYIKNIMKAIMNTDSDPIVINTSYSDAINAWIKTSGMLFPDFGSGNLNHLIPRIRFATAKEKQISDMENISITLVTSHFHDVVISKEGHTEGIEPLIDIRYQDSPLSLDLKNIYAACAIPMPVDAKRNMMNASSNYEIIILLLDAIKKHLKHTVHIPGAMGLLGGYPVFIDGTLSQTKIYINEDTFKMPQMQEVNARSIYLDGIENVKDGVLYYTDELIEKTKKHFGYCLPKQVNIEESDLVASEIITNIIEKKT